jgi:hypothetical protein
MIHCFRGDVVIYDKYREFFFQIWMLEVSSIKLSSELCFRSSYEGIIQSQVSRFEARLHAEHLMLKVSFTFVSSQVTQFSPSRNTWKILLSRLTKSRVSLPRCSSSLHSFVWNDESTHKAKISVNTWDFCCDTTLNFDLKLTLLKQLASQLHPFTQKSKEFAFPSTPLSPSPKPQPLITDLSFAISWSCFAKLMTNIRKII